MVERSFLEFFAGGGMARLGLGSGWHCRRANDIDAMKCMTYRDNWGADDLIEADIGQLHWSELRGHVDLAWASFPCQDVSLAGSGAGLGTRDGCAVTRSGAFWQFWKLMTDLDRFAEAPSIIVLEKRAGNSHVARGVADFSRDRTVPRGSRFTISARS